MRTSTSTDSERIIVIIIILTTIIIIRPAIPARCTLGTWPLGGSGVVVVGCGGW
jgi:hypothetical protein